MSSATTNAAFLGAELRRARTAARMSQDQLAQRLGFERTTITKTESGQRTPSAELADAIDVVFPYLDGLFARLAAHARIADGPVPSWFMEWLEAERVAEILRIWQPLIVPGLLQTPDYARALFKAVQPGIGEEELDRLVEARLARQAIFARAQPPYCVVVIDEGALRRRVGSARIMHDQLMHVADISERSNLTLQVTPFHDNAGLCGGFLIASSEGTSDVVISEGVEDTTSGGRAFVRKAGITFDTVRGEALPVAASRNFILEVAEEWKSQL